MQKLRTRYAPSPTGYLHIGGARTALFGYLLAKHFKGEFIVRIEDTDIARNVKNGEASQLENLAWMGIIPDESPINPNPQYAPYRQSEKFDHYYNIALELIEKGYAYKAYDSEEEIELQRQVSEAAGHPSFRYDRNYLKLSAEEIKKRDENHEFSIRLVSPKNTKLGWNDIVRGRIEFDSNEIGDWVIVKSNKIATYNFAVVVDDHDMEISHILRGEEHITNTPKQLMLYDYLGWNIPKFGHLTIITNMEGKKLSKRDTSLKQFIEDYKDEGYHPKGIFNFLTLLGWTEETAQEVMEPYMIIKLFNPERFSKSPSKFDIEKMKWFSKQHWNKEEPEQVARCLNRDDLDQLWLLEFVQLYQPGMTTLKELSDLIEIYQNPISAKDFGFEFNEEEKSLLREYKNQMSAEEEFNPFAIKRAVNAAGKVLNLKGKKLFLPIRKALTGQEHGPELAYSIFLFGKNVIDERLKHWL